MRLNPHLRARVQAVSVRPSVKRDLSNRELLDLVMRSLTGKRADKTRKDYTNHCLDAIEYFTRPEGGEIPVREWTKEDMWGYVHHVEASYCGNLHQMNFRIPVMARCKAKVWTGRKLVEDAVVTDCHGCEKFRPSKSIKHRLMGLNKWFFGLAKIGAIEVNFMQDVVREWYAEQPPEENDEEKKRNPTVEEMVRLVNGTIHPARRAFFATSAKWACRPNEMLLLDRYASFGEEMPEGCPMPPGFKRGFQKALGSHRDVKPFSKGGCLVYLPEKITSEGKKLSDKRKGNRWLVVDAELRPILEQYLAWWERTVKRDPHTGKPLTTNLWLKDRGSPERLAKGDVPNDFNARWFYPECERLGLMTPLDREDDDRKWTGHCQRHFSEQVRQLANVPSDWSNHFRGDKFRDARGHYFKPRPEQVQQKYFELMPTLGFNPLPDVPRLSTDAVRTEADTHRAILHEERRRLQNLGRSWVTITLATITVQGQGGWKVPRRIAGSFLFALRVANPDQAVMLHLSEPFPLETRSVRASDMVGACERALNLLSEGPCET